MKYGLAFPMNGIHVRAYAVLTNMKEYYATPHKVVTGIN